MSYVHVPAVLRRTGHQLTPASADAVQPRGFCSLPAQLGRELQLAVQFAKSLPDRPLAEIFLELAEKRADVPEMLRTLSAWRKRFAPEAAHDVGGDRFPRRVRAVPADLGRPAA